ncbi:MAG: PilZ domain-containing protein [Deltaproteobacteria bacterium]|nr:PilZ domain-containing protein [Deltaproteobacteria bacterium]
MLPEAVKKGLLDGRWGRISIPVRGDFPETVNALIRLESYPFLEVEFGSDQSYGSDSGVGEEWLVIISNGTDLVSFYAQLVSAVSSRQCRLRITRSQYHVQTRHHQRVKAEIYLRFRKEGEEQSPAPDPVKKKVDISPAGIRFVDSGLFSLDEELSLEMTLPGLLLQKVQCRGKVVRVVKKDDGCREIGVSLTDISLADAEKIGVFCMACQFQQMRDRAAGLTLPSPPFQIGHKPDTSS